MIQRKLSLVSEAATGGALYKKVLENFRKFTEKHP